MTKPHQRLASLLRIMGFDVENEFKVGRYRLDIYVRELHLGFECDGKRYHAGVAKSKRDKARDEWILEHAGIHIMRIQADAIQWRLWEDLKPQIAQFIDEYAGDIEARRSKFEEV